jgi:hypothetical protein
VIVAIACAGAPGAARADAIVLSSGEVIEGAIVDTTRNTAIVRRVRGGMRQMPIRDIAEIRIVVQGQPVVGELLGWTDGVYQVRSGDEVLRIGGGRILTREHRNQAIAPSGGTSAKVPRQRPMAPQLAQPPAVKVAPAVAKAPPAEIERPDLGRPPAPIAPAARSATVDSPARGAAVSNETSPAAKDEMPAAARDEAHAAARDETPAAAKDETPAAARDETPATAKDETPAASRDEAPAAAKDATPAASRDETPAVSRDEAPAVSRDEALAAEGASAAKSDAAAGAARSVGAEDSAGTVSAAVAPPAAALAAMAVPGASAAEIDASKVPARGRPAAADRVNVAATVPPARVVGALEGTAPPAAMSDDRPAVTGSINLATADPDDIVFRIELSRPAGQTVVLIYGTVDGTAKAGKDYQPRQGVLTLAPGSKSADVRVPLIEHRRAQDTRFELFLTADPKVAKIVHPHIDAIIPAAD